MLMRRDCYQRIGTHDRVKTEVNEDMHMARFAKQAGLTLRVTQNEDLYVVRMYASFAETWRGWARIFYGCFGSFKRLLLSLILLLVASISPWASLVIGIIAESGCSGTTARMDPDSEDDALIGVAAADDRQPAERLAELLGLTRREAEVLHWLCQGKSTRDIAVILGLSPRTVNKHLEQIFTKLGVENRTAAAAVGIRVMASATSRN